MLKAGISKLLSNDIFTPQTLMAIEIITIELLATYALGHH